MLSLPARDTVHLWHRCVDDPALVAAGDDTLSTSERTRAAAFVDTATRERFVAARVALRRILAGYLEVAPAGVPIDVDARGKPFVPDGPCFSLSHSVDRLLVAVAGGPVGVDVERVAPRAGLAGVARRFFSDAERRALDACAADAFPSAFFGCWTRKEALLKAAGVGLALPLRAFTVTVPPEPARLAASEDERLVVGCWMVRDVEVEGDYRAAVALRGPIHSLVTHR